MDDEQELVGTGNDDRLAKLAVIADQSEATREDELADVNDDGTTVPFVAQKPEVTETEVTEPEVTEPEVTEPEVTEPEVTEPRKFTIKVNGKELSLTEEELIARASKVASADEYLRTAKKSTEVPRGPTREELQHQRDEEDRALARALQVGTEEEAAATIRKIREQSNARPSIVMDDVSRVIDERLAFNSAITKFREEYQDVYADPYLKKIAFDRDAELIAAGDDRQYYDRYSEIGESIRAWKKSLLSQVQPAMADDLAAKAEKKAAAPTVPNAASARVKKVEAEEDADESAQDVIKAMAKSRGGPQWMRN